MAKVIEIKNKLKSITRIHDMMKAMQIIAVTQLKRAQDRQRTAQHYKEKLADLAGQFDLNLCVPDKTKRIALAYVFCSERGFCGGFNEQMSDKVSAFINEQKTRGLTVELAVVGKRGASLLKTRFADRIAKEMASDLHFDYSQAAALADQAYELFIKGQIADVYLIFNQFKSILIQVPTIAQVLPFAVASQAQNEQQIIIEPDIKMVKEQIIKEYLRIMFYDALVESQVGEVASRLITMHAATESSEKMVDDLTIKLNKARQAAITNELTEIISSFEIISEEK